MRPGIYRDRDGKLVRVSRTETGYLLRYTNGLAVAIGAAS